MTMLEENSLLTIPIIDTDSHVVEPRDLWTSRMSKKHGDLVPQVVWDAGADENRWRVGNVLLSAETEFATAGWHEHFPAHPTDLEAADPAVFDPVKRLEHLDRTGVWGQVLYPNLIGFDSLTFLAELGPEVATEAVRAYNDFVNEWASTDRNRLVPIAMLPYWDLDAAVKEARRVKGLGFTGVLMAALLSRLGEKNLSDPSWDPLLAVIQETGMSINLHIGFNQSSKEVAAKSYSKRTKVALAAYTNRLSFVRQLAMGNFSVIEATADLIVRGTFQRFPDLKMVQVESGFGWIPYLLDNMDWHWRTSAADREYPDRLFPSEIWRNNFYGTFWFEHSSIPLLEDFQDNVMFETDFPHETGIFPGHWEHNSTARDLVVRNLSSLKPEVARKVLFENAAKLYGIKAPAPSAPSA